jgi:hypothetical protein
MPYSSLFDFSPVKNIWAKVALDGVKNVEDFEVKTSPVLFRPFLAENNAFESSRVS